MERIEVTKTYKIYIGGAFPRTESGRYYQLKNKKDRHIANVCLSSRKDLRNAVVAARNAFTGWSSRNAFNRSQILYRIGEMLETRKDQFIGELILQGETKSAATKELQLAVDRVIHFAGWCDKYSQVFSSVNPVSSSHFNFSVPEPQGVVGIISSEDSGLLGLITAVLPVIAGGNTCVVLASQTRPLCAVSFAEVLNSSDVPAGVVNILTGERKELLEHFASHVDINALSVFSAGEKEMKTAGEKCSASVKRFNDYTENDLSEALSENPYLILDHQELKTTWHPVETGGASKTGY